MVDTLTHRPARMRSIKQAIAEIRAIDENTALTEHALRRLIITGQLPSVRMGTKYLVNMDLLNAYLCGQYQSGGKSASRENYGTIRIVKEG